MLYIRPLFYITCINLYKQLLDGESVTLLRPLAVSNVALLMR